MRTSVARATDRAGLVEALNKGSHASVNPDTSEFAHVVQKHIEKAIMCMYWCFHVVPHK